VFLTFSILILGLLIKNRGCRRWLVGIISHRLVCASPRSERTGHIAHQSCIINELNGAACNPLTVDRMFCKYSSSVFYVFITVPVILVTLLAAPAILFHAY
jgi:hypothetical protein